WPCFSLASAIFKNEIPPRSGRASQTCCIHSGLLVIFSTSSVACPPSGKFAKRVLIVSQRTRQTRYCCVRKSSCACCIISCACCARSRDLLSLLPCRDTSVAVSVAPAGAEGAALTAGGADVGEARRRNSTNAGALRKPACASRTFPDASATRKVG